MNHSNNPTIIDIFLHVIDNYGDIGFCLELIMAWRRTWDDATEFVIWTDSVEHVAKMVGMNTAVLGRVSVEGIEDFWHDRQSGLAWSLFHAPIPENRYFREKSLVLRIDYLSFDMSWTMHHGSEHISSTDEHRIIEIIPSPLWWWGQILPYQSRYTRDMIANMYDIDMTREWVSVFAYRDTVENILTFDTIDTDRQVLLFWYEWANPGKNITTMPWVSIDVWHACIDESVWVIARGEVSAMATLCRWKLWFWDMYKEIGGFHREQSDVFLEYMNTPRTYRDLHLELNWQIPGGVSFSELDTYIRENGLPEPKNHTRTKNLIEEIKKYIDSHEFSI